MHRVHKVHPIDIHDLENKLFDHRDIEKKEEVQNESSCFGNIWRSIFASTIKETLEEAKSWIFRFEQMFWLILVSTVFKKLRIS